MNDKLREALADNAILHELLAQKDLLLEQIAKEYNDEVKAHAEHNDMARKEIAELKAELESVKLLKDIENIPTLDLRSCHCKILSKENTELKAELERVKKAVSVEAIEKIMVNGFSVFTEEPIGTIEGDICDWNKPSVFACSPIEIQRNIVERCKKVAQAINKEVNNEMR